MKKSILFFAALAALFSCSKENPVDNYNPADDTYSVTLTASAPGADTKTTLVDGVDVEGKPIKFVHWSKGDAIKVLFFPNHTNSNTFNGPAGEFNSEFETETSKEANFRTTSWSWGFGSDVVSNRLMENGIAVYPSTAEATSNKIGSGSANNTELSFTLPDAQKAINGNIESGLNFSYAMVGRDGFKSAVESNRAMDLKFMNACALISLTMPASFEKDVTSVTISSNNEVALTGKGNVDMNYYKDVILSPFHVTPEVTETSHTVTLAKADETPLEAGATYFAVVWPGAHEGLTISFNAADGTVATKTTAGKVTLEASHVKPYTFNKGLVFESAAPKEYDYYYSDGTLGNDPSPANKKVVGVVFFWGNPSEKDAMLDSRYSHGLVLGTSEYKRKWHDGSFPFTSDQLKSAGVTNKDGDTYGYTAFYNLYVMNTNLTLYKNRPDNPEGGSVWYVPTNCEWKMIANKCESLNEKLIACGGSELKLGEIYWTPLASSPNYQYYVKLEMSNGVCDAKISSGYKYYQYEYLVRPIFAF